MAPPLVKILTKVDPYLDTREDFDKALSFKTSHVDLLVACR